MQRAKTGVLVFADLKAGFGEEQKGLQDHPVARSAWQSERRTQLSCNFQ